MEETTDLLVGLGKIAMAAEDGIGLEDIGVIAVLPSMISGINKVPEEVNNATDADWDKLKAKFREEFDLTNDQTEILVEKCVDAAVALFGVYQAYQQTKVTT